MMKKLVCRGALGFFLGIAADFIISYVTSLYLNLGYFMAYLDSMREPFGGEMQAVLAQALVLACLGAGIGMMTAVLSKKEKSGSKLIPSLVALVIALLPLILVLCKMA